MEHPYPLLPLLYVLAGYLLLQILLNLLIALLLRRVGRRAVHALLATFWSGVINALYFIVAAVLLHVWEAVPNRDPPPGVGWYALAGLPLGAGLWYLTTLARKLGRALFGRGELIAAEDAILRVPPHPRYLAWGVLNLTLIQPAGRELFLRGAFLPAVVLTFGWGGAVAATLVVELLLRLNVVWALQTLTYALVMCGLFYMTGGALTGLVAAAVSGLIHGMMLAHIGFREALRREE